MNLGKKIAALGLIGILSVGQSMSALAATTFTVNVPFVKYLSPNYQVTGTVSASTADYYLSLRQWIVYIPNNSTTESASDVRNSYSSSKIKTYTATHTINIDSGVAKRAISRGYSSNTKGVQQNMVGQSVYQMN